MKLFNFFARKKVSHSVSEDVERIFKEALGVKQVEPAANFFELGGDSILATVVIASLDEIGHHLPSTAIFDYPTVNTLVEFIEDRASRAASLGSTSVRVHARNIDRATPFRASLLQERLWPYERNPDPQRFQVRGEGAVFLKGILDVEILEKSFTKVLERHEVLRSTFKEMNGALQLYVHPPKPFSLEVLVANGDGDEERKADASRIITDVTSQVFDLEIAPPFRCVLVKLSNEEHALAVSTHHIISDGWSMGILVNEIMNTYDALAQNRPESLPILSYQFADYAAWHREWLDSSSGQASVDFWRTYLTGLQPALNVPLPADQPRQSEANFPVRRTNVMVDAQTQGAIRSMAKSTKTSVHTVFLAGFLKAFQSVSSAADLPIGIMHANRHLPGTENLIGYFSTMVMMRFKFKQENMSFTELVEMVRDATRTITPHCGVPIGVLMDEGIVDTSPRIFVDSVPRPEMQSIQDLSLEEFPFKHPPLFAFADLSAFLFDNGKDLRCLLGTNEDMFSDAAAINFATALAQSLKSIET